MSNLRPFWQRHPHLLRVVAALLLLSAPAWFIPFCVWFYREEIASEIRTIVRGLLSIVRTGDC